MQISKAKDEYIPQAKQLWNSHFDNGTPGFCYFAFSLLKKDDIYIAVEDDKVIAMIMAITELEYKKQKGFYLYSACTHPDYEDSDVMQKLTEFALKDQDERGKSFCAVAPGSEEKFTFWQSMGFDKVVSMRKCEVEIKRNIWNSAEFDIITASRFRPAREKYGVENIVHYTQDSYGKYTRYMYTCGGSTAEMQNAYCVYFIENGQLVVKELLAQSTLHATQILQAVRERTGFEQATVYLSEDSTLFLGEGHKEKMYAVRGISDDVYINLMFE